MKKTFLQYNQNTIWRFDKTREKQYNNTIAFIFNQNIFASSSILADSRSDAILLRTETFFLHLKSFQNFECKL